MTMAGAVPWLVAVAFRPILEPLPLDDYWMVLVLPLVVAVAVVYKTIKLKDLSHLPWQVLRLSVQIIVFMVVAAAVLKWLTDWI